MTLGALADALAELEDLKEKRSREMVPIHFRRGELEEHEYRQMEKQRQQRLAEYSREIERLRAIQI